MSTLYVDTITEKTAGNGVQIPGHVVQVQYRAVVNNGFSTTSASMVDVTDWYVDITPKFSNSILVWQTSFSCNNTTAASYDRYRIVDGLNSNTQWSVNTYMGMSNYYTNATEWDELALLHANTAGTTNAMRLQLQILVIGGGTFSNGWSASDTRMVMVTEIAQ
jgi:hypothetical protein